MAKLIVNGGKKLSGRITPSGNKNAVLPIICATLLTEEQVTLKNVPNITDVETLLGLMENLGSEIHWDRENLTLKIKNREISLDNFDGNFPLEMRGAVLLLGPLFARLKNIKIVPKAGGCTLGLREIDNHLEALAAIGAKIDFSSDKVTLKSENGYPGGEYWGDFMSVTATENLLMAATLSKGKSISNNSASEPHVQDLTNFLIKMGAKIKGLGTSKLEVEGVEKLSGCEHTIISDHHEITTFLALGAMTGGRLEAENAIPEHFGLINKSFEKLGVKIKYHEDTAIVEEGQKVQIQKPHTDNLIPKIEAAPWPYFPADLHPLMMALATQSKDGQIMFWNKVYEGGLLWMPELQKFGVKLLLCDPHRVLIWGGLELNPTTVVAPTIIRATVALLMVALAIDGESTIENADAIKRAHPGFAEKLISLGADVRWE